MRLKVQFEHFFNILNLFFDLASSLADGMYAFVLEEVGNYAEAEKYARLVCFF